MLLKTASVIGYALALAAVTVAAVTVSEAAAQAPSRTLLDRYCVTCHNERLQTANLTLDAVDLARIGDHTEALEKVVRKLRAGQMPPEGRPRPAREEVETFVAALEAALDREAAGQLTPGRVASRRMNRIEYVNAIEDLLDLRVDGAELLPSDMAGFGFDNNADVLAMTPSLMARYIAAATKISRVAVGSLDNRPDGRVYSLGFEMQDARMHEDMPFGTHGGLAARHVFPLDGEYLFTIRMKRGAGGTSGQISGIAEDGHDIELRIDHVLVRQWNIGGRFRGAIPGLTIADDDVEAIRTHQYRLTADHEMEIRVPVEADQRLVSVAFTDSNPTPVDGVYGRPGIDRVFIAGPYDGTVPDETPSRARIFVCRPAGTSAADEAACASEILETLVRRAYRRPATERDLGVLMPFYEDGRRERDFEAGIERGLEAILSMPEFLLRAERQPAGVAAGDAYRLSDLELASRLSFFLWRSIPDDELLDVATEGRLSNPDILGRQVRRMLADPKATRFMNDFAGQWLQVRNINEQLPDGGLFAQFNDTLRKAMVTETELFFESQVRENRPIPELLRADHTYLNEQLARHYGVDDIYGSPVPPGRARRRPAPRPAGPREHTDDHLVREPHLGGAARKMDAGEHPRRPAAGPAAERAAARGERPGGRADLAAGEDGAAPEQSGLRELPRHDRPAGVCARALRRDRAMARCGRRRTDQRHDRVARADHRQPARISRSAAGPRQHVRADGDREVAHLRAGARGGLQGRTHGTRVGARPRAGRVQMVIPDCRDRQQHSVPDAAGPAHRQPGCRSRGCGCGASGG